jgi:hypothetical protein
MGSRRSSSDEPIYRQQYLPLPCPSIFVWYLYHYDERKRDMMPNISIHHSSHYQINVSRISTLRSGDGGRVMA